MPVNPVKRLKRAWFPEPRRIGVVRTEDLPRFYQAVKALKNEVSRDFILVLLFSGLRKTECATLKWSDVDFGERVIRLQASATKAGRRLDLPMSDVTRDILVARRALGDTGFIFPGAGVTGRLWDPGLAAVTKATGIKVTAHDLRRTYASIAEGTGISFVELKALLNHALPGDITSSYVIVSPQRLKEAAQTVADKIKSLCRIEDVVTEGSNVARL